MELVMQPAFSGSKNWLSAITSAASFFVSKASDALFVFPCGESASDALPALEVSNLWATFHKI